MTLPLPYAEYTWSISQHMRKATKDSRLIFTLLEGAALYGREKGYSDKITSHVIKKKLIPPNIRESRPQIWRDYQQVLVELGLIVSTRYTAGSVIVTPIGLMLLDGLLGVRELLTTQALRYQYPNAYKLSVPNAVRQQLADERSEEEINRAAIDHLHGVLIKPAVLVLRILLEQMDGNERPKITNRECAAALMPIRKNSEWPMALAELLKLRRERIIPQVDVRALRHIQEWFSLLSATDFFSEKNGVLTLSDAMFSDIPAAAEVCAYQEELSTYWYSPAGNNVSEWVHSWFSYYGAPELNSQWTISSPSLTKEYVNENYPKGIEILDVEDAYALPRDFQDWSGKIRLQPFGRTEEDFETHSSTNRLGSSAALVRLERGIARRQKSTRLHEYVVTLVAKKLSESGFNVFEDPQSVDLLASKDGSESIFEIKTVTPRNLIPRLRLGVGQLSEYRYRLQTPKGIRPNGVLVLSSDTNPPPLIKSFFRDEVQLGLVGLSAGEKFISHTSGLLEDLLTH